ncbi:MAG: hypothetical protein QXU82_01525 [Candidatus Aenigmatarchaeota archaeon]
MALTEVILALREAGFALVLLWALTLALVYGLLQHVNIPKSVTARGVISITAAFLVLLAAAAGPAVAFLENLVTASIIIAFGLLLTVIFLEIAGVKVGESKISIFASHPKFFGAIILVLFVVIFIGAGGLQVIGLPRIVITEAVATFVLLIAVMIGAIWVLMKESKG